MVPAPVPVLVARPAGETVGKQQVSSMLNLLLHIGAGAWAPTASFFLHAPACGSPNRCAANIWKPRVVAWSVMTLESSNTTATLDEQLLILPPQTATLETPRVSEVAEAITTLLDEPSSPPVPALGLEDVGLVAQVLGKELVGIASIPAKKAQEAKKRREEERAAAEEERAAAEKAAMEKLAQEQADKTAKSRLAVFSLLSVALFATTVKAERNDAPPPFLQAGSMLAVAGLIATSTLGPKDEVNLASSEVFPVDDGPMPLPPPGSRTTKEEELAFASAARNKVQTTLVEATEAIERMRAELDERYEEDSELQMAVKLQKAIKKSSGDRASGTGDSGTTAAQRLATVREIEQLASTVRDVSKKGDGLLKAIASDKPKDKKRSPILRFTKPGVKSPTSTSAALALATSSTVGLEPSKGSKWTKRAAMLLLLAFAVSRVVVFGRA